MVLGVVDIGIGNLGSLKAALKKLNIQFKILLILLCITDAIFGSGKAWPYLIVDHQKRRLVHFLQ